MPGKCSFQACWLDKPEFKKWLARVPVDTCGAACKICKKSFPLQAKALLQLQAMQTARNINKVRILFFKVGFQEGFLYQFIME